MRFLIKCKICEATQWVRGTEEPDVNACEINDHVALDCCPCIEQGGYNIVDSEYDDEDCSE